MRLQNIKFELELAFIVEMKKKKNKEERENPYFFFSKKSISSSILIIDGDWLSLFIYFNSFKIFKQVYAYLD